MSGSTSITIVNVGYRSTTYWVISAGRSRLLLERGATRVYPGHGSVYPLDPTWGILE